MRGKKPWCSMPSSGCSGGSPAACSSSCPGIRNGFRRRRAARRRRGSIRSCAPGAPRTAPAPMCSSATPWAELPLFYAAADVAFVGGTLVEGGGHNMLEPAALGAAGAVRTARVQLRRDQPPPRRGGRAQTVGDAASLGEAVIDYLNDADLRHATGARGRAFVEANRRCRRPRGRADRGAPGGARARAAGRPRPRRLAAQRHHRDVHRGPEFRADRQHLVIFDDSNASNGVSSPTRSSRSRCRRAA